MSDKSKPLISFDNYDKYETTNIVNSPRSLKACQSEGIDPKSLIKKSLKNFSSPGKAKEISELEYKLYNKKRSRNFKNKNRITESS